MLHHQLYSVHNTRCIIFRMNCVLERGVKSILYHRGEELRATEPALLPCLLSGIIPTATFGVLCGMLLFVLLFQMFLKIFFFIETLSSGTFNTVNRIHHAVS